MVPSHITSQNLPTIDKDQLRHLEEVREKGLPEKDHLLLPQVPLGTPGAPVAPSCPTGSALGSHERARKLPIWQQVANEKSTVFQNKKYVMANIFFFLVLHPFQDYFSSYETGQSVGGEKMGEPREKPPGTPASRTCLVSHVTSAGLEPTPETWTSL